MDYSNSFQISAAGMRLEKMRVDVTALNIANMNTSRTSGGQAFQPMKVVARANPGLDFSALMANGGALASQAAPLGEIVPTLAAPRVLHDPGHPDADAQGKVSYPGVDHLGEMVNLLSAMRAYEANLVALNASRVMASKALEIGGAL
jgi:flagellar basal-body rod protein FlgC